MSLTIGDCRVTLARWAAEGVRVQCVVTSPPYWGLRDYDTEPLVWEAASTDPKFGALPAEVCRASAHDWGEDVVRSMSGGVGSGTLQGTQHGAMKGGDVRFKTGSTFSLRCAAWRGSLGLEPTPEMYVTHLVDVFRLVRDVMAEDATLWLNLGDSYASGEIGRHDNGSTYQDSYDRKPFGSRQQQRQSTGLKPKDLVGIPWRVAFALQADGWWLRSDIIWAKPNPMPESVTDRPTKAHEYLFLLTKRASYFYDSEAIKEPFADERNGNPGKYARTTQAAKGANRDRQDTGFLNHGAGWNEDGAMTARNRRSVWTIATTPYPDAHFATFPEDLVKPCILAGTSARGMCPKCGAQWERIVVKVTSHEGHSAVAGRSQVEINGSGKWQAEALAGNAGLKSGPVVTSTTTGWEPGCACGLEPVPAVVLDPFIGSGTVAQVAQDLGRRWLGCELNPAYAPMSEKRTRQQGLAL